MAAAGQARDRFIQLTEGVIASEELERPVRLERVERASGRTCRAGARLGGRMGAARASVALALSDERLTLDLRVDPAPFRLDADWEARPGERFTGLGARHGEQLDQTGRHVRLGADRRYTGPDCPPDILDVGGIPQGDYAPVPWLLASRGYALWLETDGDGAAFDLGHRIAVSSRAAAGAFRLHVLTDPTPAARLRRFLRLTGLPALLPEWAYGHWKSRDVFEHQRDAENDFEGYERHRIPLDAIVIDSPWGRRWASPGVATRPPASGPSRRSWPPPSPRRRAATRTGRTTWAPTPANGSWRAAPGSCSSVGSSSAALRR